MRPNLLTPLLASLTTLAVVGGCTMSRVSEAPPISNATPVPPVETNAKSAHQSVTIGTSVNGRAIEVFRFAGRTAAKPVLIFAGIHGDERSTVAVARQLVKLLNDSPDAARPPVVLIPLVNPDGYEARTRTNARGVDLNRNFPADNFKASSKGRYANGSQPLSEPESLALHDLVEQLKPARILTIHSIRPPKHGNNFDGPAESLAKLMASKNHYNVLPTMGYATPGSFGSWAGIDLQIPTITLELPSNTPAEKAWVENRDAILAFIRGH